MHQLTFSQLNYLANRPLDEASLYSVHGATVKISIVELVDDEDSDRVEEEYVINIATHPPTPDGRSVTARFELRSIPGKIRLARHVCIRLHRADSQHDRSRVLLFGPTACPQHPRNVLSRARTQVVSGMCEVSSPVQCIPANVVSWACQID